MRHFVFIEKCPVEERRLDYLNFTGIMASIHSPWPSWSSLTVNISLEICTRSPTLNEGFPSDLFEEFDSVAVVCWLPSSSVSESRRVSTAGLSNHLKRTMHESYERIYRPY